MHGILILVAILIPASRSRQVTETHYLDDWSDGLIGFIGADRIAFPSTKFWENIDRATDSDFEKLFAASNPIAYSDFVKKKRNDPKLEWPRVPVRMKEQLWCAFLGNRLPEYIAVKSKHGIVILECLALAEHNAHVRLKIHTCK